MNSILKELYFKSFITKNADKTIAEEKELAKLLEINVTKLKAALTNEQKEKLEKVTDCFEELSAITCCEDFVTGFRLGGRVVMEMFFGMGD